MLHIYIHTYSRSKIDQKAGWRVANQDRKGKVTVRTVRVMYLLNVK